MKINKFILCTIALVSSALFSMESNEQVIQVDSPIEVDSSVETTTLVSEDQKPQGLYNRCKNILAKNKKVAMAIGSGALAIGSNVVFGASNAPAATIFLGTFGTSIKGILPKSTDKQALKIGLAVAVGAAAIGADIGLKQLGFDTHYALSNCALIGGMAVLKRVQKGHIKGDAKKDKEAKEAKKEKKEKTGKVINV